ncbi:ATP synthase F0 subcomplex subunit OSCP ATP5 [Phycomyces blakesleeanus NRRL 1555(-)]|uniref:ATP synthase subunit 5, mitochondrial n=1 Tax=Phycomyces blakesleeanus (strain ATCC 8743b / DSM 1359 / FGSC 10004 / NBRC 33097 / NRRL 1555) TaxID=763407 RepID=A0A162XTG3_PHYB8|nr:ATP synthase F0 subcomplex subunit OSCP ATP5 [Phycomyces blakesleeanus NRRL 1555(-)]OAD76395.1 ATP synthase F0 subcomplex subunit OSCP ATP5 [Phycomyces blakesleeanus NRRL 1555(-)]|eukprot:XP_018294435.1 ATP synthase F0 subcomplex subunit OSCP ATP5 [Phycomyces blakesleeanus NRRL 1555(-)]
MASRFTRLTTVVPQLARGYAAPAKTVKVPVTLFGLNGRYATALYSAAARQNALDAVEKDLKALDALVVKDKGVQAFLENPTINRKVKLDGINALLSKAGKPSEVTKNLFETLSENGRLDQTTKVISSFAELMSAHRNELSLVITSTKELDKATLNKIAESLQKSGLSEGKKLLVSNKVKADILGGLLVEIGDKSIDLTVSTRLAKLNKLVTDSI